MQSRTERARDKINSTDIINRAVLMAVLTDKAESLSNSVSFRSAVEEVGLRIDSGQLIRILLLIGCRQLNSISSNDDINLDANWLKSLDLIANFLKANSSKYSSSPQVKEFLDTLERVTNRSVLH